MVNENKELIHTVETLRKELKTSTAALCNTNLNNYPDQISVSPVTVIDRNEPLVENCVNPTNIIKTADSNIGICISGEPLIPEAASVENPLDNSCLIVQPASCNQTNNRFDTHAVTDELKSMKRNINNNKVSKAKVSQNNSRHNHNSPPYCEPRSLKSLGNLPFIEIPKPFLTRKKEIVLENSLNLLNENTTSTKTTTQVEDTVGNNPWLH